LSLRDPLATPSVATLAGALVLRKIGRVILTKTDRLALGSAGWELSELRLREVGWIEVCRTWEDGEVRMDLGHLMALGCLDPRDVAVEE